MAFIRRTAPRLVRVRRSTAGFRRGDLLVVLPGETPEGGEIVIDTAGRIGRHGGGPIWGIVVGAVRHPVAAAHARVNPP